MSSSCLPRTAGAFSAKGVTGVASQGQLRLSLLRIALLAVPGVLLLGTLSGVLSGSGDNGWYQNLDKPSFNPPPQAFAVVWPILYVMQGLALAMVIHAVGATGRQRALVLFAIQFALNLLWSPLFFGAHETVIAAMLGVALPTTLRFFQVRRAAGLLMLPYLAWIAFALALNIAIVQLNPDAELASAASDAPSAI